MPRKPRVFVEGGVYHVFNRFARGEAVFADPEEALEFVELLRFVKKRDGWTIVAWTLMLNHFHLAVRSRAVPWPDEVDLRNLMSRFRNVSIDEDQWSFHLLVGRKNTPSREFSHVIDPENRSGAVVFVDPSPDQAGPTLHAIAHEIGHLLNLPHPWDAYGNTRSVMSYPWRWADWSWLDRDAFRFDLVGRRHIRGDPEWFVRPGSSGFGGAAGRAGR